MFRDHENELLTMAHARASMRGFTLIELAVVAAIIGLLIGGIISAKHMIHVVKINQTIAQKEEFDIAVNAFQLKYDCLPGDCTDASKYFDPTTNGNGNLKIGMANGTTCPYSVGSGCSHRFNLGGGSNSLSVMREYTNFWYHLYAAKLLKYPSMPYAANSANGVNDIFRTTATGIVTPRMKIPIAYASLLGGGTELPGGWSIDANAKFTDESGNLELPVHHSYILGNSVSVPATVFLFFYQGILVSDAYSIDAKMDDGLPRTGKVRGITTQIGYTNLSITPDAHGMHAGPGGPGTLFCIRNDTTPHSYNLDYSGEHSNSSCGIAVQAAF